MSPVILRNAKIPLSTCLIFSCRFLDSPTSLVKFKNIPCRVGNIFLMSSEFLSPVDFKKRPCRPVDFKGRGPMSETRGMAGRPT